MKIKDFITAFTAYWHNAIFQIERDIYCATNCRIELPLHRKYYADRKRRYNNYLQLHYMSTAEC